ncbi:NepR family anti-sigma factor [Methylocystis sp. S23]|jgi:hypothetical protein
MTAASKQHAQFKEPIPERGVLLSVQRTISRDEIGPPQKIMALQIGGSMVNNNPENAAARAQSDEDRAETRHFSGTLSRGVAAIAAGLGAGAGASRRGNGRKEAPDANGMTPGGLSLCASERTNKKMRNVDFGDAIGKELQNLYDDLVAQPVPDRFLNLLNQLEKNMVSSGLSNGAPGERE